MSDANTIMGYLSAVRSALGDLPTAEREEALAELESLLVADAARSGETAAVSSLGDPDEYATQVREALAANRRTAADPQGHVLGMPYDFRGGSVDRIGARMWNPADAGVFTPRLFGVGWTINFGALAVKLGLLRPDDLNEDTFESVPRWAVRIIVAVPLAIAVATTALIALSWGSLPAQVPVHWNAAGTPDSWAPKILALGGVWLLSALPVFVVLGRMLIRRAAARDRVLSAAALSLMALLGLGVTGLTIADARGSGASGGMLWVVILGAIALSFVLLYVPSRLALRAEWREIPSNTEKGE